MPTFSYKALAADGSETAGQIEAETQPAALKKLSQDGLTVFEVVEGLQGESVRWYNRQLFQSKTISDVDLADVSEGLAAMLEQHLSLDNALGVLINTSSRPKVAAALKQVRTGLQSGATPLQAFNRASDSFPGRFTSMVHAGATANALAAAFAGAATYYRNRNAQRHKVLSAVAYPTFLIFAVAMVFIIILQTMVPALYDTLQSSGRIPSGSINFLYIMSEASRQYWQAIAVAMAVCTMLMISVRRQILLALAHVTPPLRKHIEERSFSRCASELNMLLQSGETLEGALSALLHETDDEIFHGPVEQARHRIRSGERAAVAFRESDQVPASFLQLFDLGERSNSLSSMLQIATQTLDASSERRLKRATGFLTPILTLVVGGLVALLVQILMTAVLEVSQVAV